MNDNMIVTFNIILLEVCQKYKQICELYQSVEFINTSYFI